MIELNLILIGAIVLSCALTSLCFLRSWKATRDRFFLFFSLSFFLQGAGTLVMGLARHSYGGEAHPLIYLIRLLAFVLILIAIMDKNRAQATETRKE
jgi:hypothetical protein